MIVILIQFKARSTPLDVNLAISINIYICIRMYVYIYIFIYLQTMYMHISMYACFFSHSVEGFDIQGHAGFLPSTVAAQN